MNKLEQEINAIANQAWEKSNLLRKRAIALAILAGFFGGLIGGRQGVVFGAIGGVLYAKLTEPPILSQ